jgi:hypothetical protein
MTEHAPRDHARLLTRVLQRMFPNHAHRLEARRILEQYGGSATEPEAERVRLAVLKLAGADIGQLRSGVLGAKEDYEDTLSWAESPSETKRAWEIENLIRINGQRLQHRIKSSMRIGFTVMPPKSSNHAMERTAGSFGSLPPMKFYSRSAATGSPVSLAHLVLVRPYDSRRAVR